MIHQKEFQIQEIAAASSSGTNSIAQETSSSDNVLSSLFRARMQQSAPLATTNHGGDQPQQRVAPLVSSMAGASASLFQADSSPSKAAFHSSSCHLPTTSLFHQLGQSNRFQSNSFDTNRNVAFPLHSELFSTAAPFPSSPLNTRPNQQPSSSSSSGPEDLEQCLRSLSAALKLSHRATASMIAQSSVSTSSPINMRNNCNTKRRPLLRNQATRMRLVGQVLGQKGVQKLLSVIKELKKIPQCAVQPSILVDAWENTPLNDLKALPWDEMLRDAQISLEAYAAHRE